MAVIGIGSTHSSMSRSTEPDDIVREKSTPVTLLCRMVPLVEPDSGVLWDRRGRRQCRRSFGRLGGRTYGDSVPDDSAFAYVAKGLHASPRLYQAEASRSHNLPISTRIVYGDEEIGWADVMTTTAMPSNAPGKLCTAEKKVSI